VTPISSKFNSKGIYATKVSTDTDVYNRNYTYLDDNTSFKTSSVEVYKVTYDADYATNAAKAYNVETTTVKAGDEVIYFKTSAGVQYVIDVKQSVFGRNDTAIKAVDELYKAITKEQDTVDSTIPTLSGLTVKGADVTIGSDNKGSIELTATQAAATNTDHIAFKVKPATTSVVVYAGTTEVAMTNTSGSVAPTSDQKAITAAETLTITLVNGTKTNTYTVDVTVAAKKQDATIKTLKVKGVEAVAGDNNTYTVDLTASQARESGTNPLVEVETNDVNAKIKADTLANGTSTDPLGNTLTLDSAQKVTTAKSELTADSGSFTFTIEAEDTSETQNYTVTVNVAKPVLTYSANGNVKTHTNTAMTVTGTGKGNYKYSDEFAPETGYFLKSVKVGNTEQVSSYADTQSLTLTNVSVATDDTVTVETAAINYTVTFTTLGTNAQTITVTSANGLDTATVALELYDVTTSSTVGEAITSQALDSGTYAFSLTKTLTTGHVYRATATIGGQTYVATATLAD
jgi:hypothetical protein